MSELCKKKALSIAQGLLKYCQPVTIPYTLA